MPKLWNDTIEAHRRAVRDATLDATAALVADHGLAAVTMSQIAARAGIGRATLYKYFPDVDAILLAWHERQIAAHLDQLRQAREQVSDPAERLAHVLQTYAGLSRRDHAPESAAVLHHGPHVAQAQDHVQDLIRDLLTDDIRAGRVRTDVPADELAAYCLQALRAADDLPTPDAVRRLVGVVMDGLRRHADAS